jgi:hypothetical protein
MKLCTRSAAFGLLMLGGLAAGDIKVVAQTPPGELFDPTQLPETKGTVKQYTLAPRGDVDGLILADGTEVHFPPHLSAQIVFAVHPGDAVTIRGLKARALPLIDGASITNNSTHVMVINTDRPERGLAEATVTGQISNVLHGRRGEVNGVVLDTGSIVRVPPEQAVRLGDQLRVGRPLTARGDRTSNVLGEVVDAQAVGASPDQLIQIDAPRKPKPPRGGPDDRGPPPPPPPPHG